MFLGQIRPLHCSILALTSVLVILLFDRCRSWWHRRVPHDD
jgi:hypothetical protein